MIDRTAPLPKQQPLDRAQAIHLLRRSGFGAPPADVVAAIERGLHATVDLLLDANSDPLPELDAIQDVVAAGEIDQLQAWWVARMIRTSDPLREKVALFWHGHFATSHDKVEDPRLMADHLRLFLDHGMGEFAPLLHRIADDPAMLIWLDGERNQKGKPNENFARELFELFTLGIGNYTETDVQEAARAFTGWRRAGTRFKFIDKRHDDGDKRILGELRPFDAAGVLDLVGKHPATARRLTRQLLRYFAEPEPSLGVIDAFAARLIESDFHIGRFLSLLFRSSYFFDPSIVGQRISSPVEFVIGMIRTLDARSDAGAVARRVAKLGQAILRPPSVKGWEGEESWIHAASMVARVNAVGDITSSKDRLTLDLDLDEDGDLDDASVAEVVRSVTQKFGIPNLEPDVVRAIERRVDDAPAEERRRVAVTSVLSLPEASLC